MKRVLKQVLENGKPVIINSGRNYLRYEYSPDQETFMDGIKVLEGDDAHSLEAFRGVADTYKVQQGIEEFERESK